MGQRGEVFSTKFVTNDRTYFFNVKENYRGDMYLNVVESKVTADEGRFIRQSIIVYPEDLGEFLRELQKSVDFMRVNADKRKPREQE
ncbi:MAG: PUR family DNA/RNA-binding protein [Sphaerochaetaceae bacterium]|nr:PUR family DNA/RNA-binding protein [Sphaerochaetaceae bacterium]